MLTKTEVLKHLGEARAKATDEQDRLNALGRFSEAIDQRRGLDLIETGIHAVLNTAPDEILSGSANAQIRHILEPYAAKAK